MKKVARALFSNFEFIKIRKQPPENIHFASGNKTVSSKQ